MSERDELATVLRDNRTPWATNTEHRQMEEAQAAAIHAAGYRKPHTITTAEELDALHAGAVIIDKFGDVSQLRGGEWCGYETAPLNSRTIAKWLPATVLYEGTP